MSAIKKAVQSITARLSEQHLICFDWNVIIVLSLSLILFCLAVGTKLHLSSIAVWNIAITENSTIPRESVLAGSPKGIRADEWMVATPFILSQVAHGFPEENSSFGYGKVPLITSFSALPVKHFTSLFKPQSWPFFLFDIETAFAMSWCFRVFGLFLASFLLLLLLTRNNFGISLFGALWLFFSSYIQWWLGIQSTDYVIAICMLAISCIYILCAQKAYTIIISGVIFIFFLLNLIFIIYPSWQVAIVYLLPFIVVGYVINTNTLRHAKNYLSVRIIVGIAALIIVSAMIAFFYQDIKETIQLMAKSEYPGNKFSKNNGGDVSFLRFFSGFFDLFYKQERFPYINVCESVAFIPIFPLIIVSTAKDYLLSKKVDWLLVSLIAYILLITVFMTVGLPSIVARYTLLNMTYGTRPFLGLLTSTIILSAVFLSSRRPLQNHRISEFLVTFLVTFVLIASFSIYWSHKNADFLKPHEITFVTLIFSIAFAALAVKKNALFIVLIMAIVLPTGLRINPLGYGLSPLFDKDLASVARTIEKQDPGALWACYGNNFIANFMKAMGLNVFNGLKYVPDLETMSLLDPDGQYRVFYNRYAHIEFHLSHNDVVTFAKASAHNLHDHISVFISPLSHKFKLLGIKYVVLPNVMPDNPDYIDISGLPQRNLRLIYSKPINGYWICKLVDVSSE
jgi:hypothetical protein